jgi:hypothetical protein
MNYRRLEPIVFTGVDSVPVSLVHPLDDGCDFTLAVPRPFGFVDGALGFIFRPRLAARLQAKLGPVAAAWAVYDDVPAKSPGRSLTQKPLRSVHRGLLALVAVEPIDAGAKITRMTQRGKLYDVVVRACEAVYHAVRWLGHWRLDDFICHFLLSPLFLLSA